jgi:hypothetical protein
MGIRLYYLFGILFMTSCVSVKFTVPQPENVEEMKSFPKSWRGTYVTDTNDTLFLEGNALVFKDSLKAEKYIVGRQILIKKSGKYIVINVKNEQNWDVIIAQKKRQNLNLFALDISQEEQKKIEKISGLTPVKTIKNSEEKVDYYLIIPSKEDFEKLIKNDLFTPFLYFEKVK